jgi:hypothetical protein
MNSFVSASVCMEWSLSQSSKHIPFACQDTQVNFVPPSRLTVGGLPARAIASKIRRVFTLTSRGVLPVNSLFRTGLQSLTCVAGWLTPAAAPAAWPPARAVPPPPLLLLPLLLAPVRLVFWEPPAGRDTCNKACSCGTLAQDGTHDRLLFCSKVCKPVQKSGKGMCVSLLIYSASQLRYMSCT